MGALAEAGIRLVGENRAEGLETKWSRWKDSFEFHFIGHLQSRKVPRVLPYVSLIHSVESISLVEELDKRAETEVQVLLEVNVSGEESKYGILPAAAETFLERAAAYRRVRFTGLMTMAPLVPDAESTRTFFRELRELRDRLATSFTGRYELTELSMGMSNDYEVAVEEGATIVRIGSALLSDA
jgi:PLP dependent protein